MVSKIERSKLIKANDQTNGCEEIPLANDVQSDSAENSARINRGATSKNEKNNNGFDGSSSGDGSCIQSALVMGLFLTTTALMVAFPFFLYQSAYVHGWIGHRYTLPYNNASTTATPYHEPLKDDLNKTDLNMTAEEKNQSSSTSSPIPASPIGPGNDDSRSSRRPVTVVADSGNDLKKQQTKGYDNKDENDGMMKRKGYKTVLKVAGEQEKQEEEYDDAGRMKRSNSDPRSSGAFVAVVGQAGIGADARTRRHRIKRTFNFETRDEKAEEKEAAILRFNAQSK